MISRLPQSMLQMLRFYYGIRWMMRRRKRIDFITYYRFVVSTGFTDLLTCIMIIMSNTRTHWHVIAGQIIYIFFLLVELIIVELYLRYLDAV